MPERPLLRLPAPEPISPPPLPRGGGGIVTPSHAAQAGRLRPTFQRLKEALERGPDDLLQLRDDPTALAPDRVIVFEVAGTIDDLARAAAKVPGLELLVEYDTEHPADEDFAARDTRKGHKGQRRDDKLVEGRLYLAMPDVAALRDFLRLWDTWEAEKDLDKGFAPFKHLFEQLRTVRPWGPQDRIPPETIAYWREEVALHPDRAVRTEVELWFRNTPERRRRASTDFREQVRMAGGTVLHEAIIPEIAYHGVLIDIPAAAVADLPGDNVALAFVDDVMFLRPQTVFSSPPEATELADGPIVPIDVTVPAGEPIAALLDGVPLQGHERLDGRLFFDDPDDLQALALVHRRAHGTAMASLILHGDLLLPGPALSRPLYVRPVLVAPEAPSAEETPRDRLVVDTIYQAVMRLKGTDALQAVAPSVFLVNLSLGDPRRAFANLVSPLARLLDHLAAQHNLLFLVSAGNVRSQLALPLFSQWGDFKSSPPEARERAVLMALFESKHERSLLSPAEAVNALTIGAQHTDNLVNRRIPDFAADPFGDDSLPNASCAMGLGYRRSVKPDLFLPGGRELVRMAATGHGVRLGFGPPQRLYGLCAAAPDGAGGGRLNQTAHSDGTSAATALATRAAHRIFDALMDRAGGSLLAEIPPEYYAVVVKALLVHSAKWNGNSGRIGEICGPAGGRQHVERSANATRYLGFGIPDIERVLDCAENRATLVGYGELSPDHWLKYSFPLPPSLERVTDPRALTVTLAWLTPVRPGHQGYRAVKLEAAPLDPAAAFGVSRFKDQPSDPTVKKGTVFHERFAGERAVPFLDDGHLTLRVWCKDDAGTRSAPVRYALAVTVEAGTPIPVYEEVREQLRVRTRPPA